MPSQSNKVLCSLVFGGPVCVDLLLIIKMITCTRLYSWLPDWLLWDFNGLVLLCLKSYLIMYPEAYVLDIKSVNMLASTKLQNKKKHSSCCVFHSSLYMKV